MGVSFVYKRDRLNVWVIAGRSRPRPGPVPDKGRPAAYPWSYPWWVNMIDRYAGAAAAGRAADEARSLALGDL